MTEKFTFIDLFAGVGGFHAALADLGGRCVYAAEKDRYARAVYNAAWNSDENERFPIAGDINDDVPIDTGHTIDELLERAKAGEITLNNIPKDFDVLTAGFPCQAFSKSGKQEGILDRVRGTLFYNILVIVAMRRPKVVFLENVKNLVGPSHLDTTFKTIVQALSGLGYAVSLEPTIFSPHAIAPQYGGGPQSRERVYILAVLNEIVSNREPFTGPGRSEAWSIDSWRIDSTPLPTLDGLPAVITQKWAREVGSAAPALAARVEHVKSLYMNDLSDYRLTRDDRWFEVYARLVANVVAQRSKNRRGSWFPGHPIWFDVADRNWVKRERADAEAHQTSERTREWKDEFLDKSLDFIAAYAAQLKGPDSGDVLKKILALPSNAWRKLEWQATGSTSLDDCLIQLRPSGVRVKKATYTPALVAINQAPILGSEQRRLTPYEAGRLQGFPDRVYGAMLETKQPEGQSYKQFGNAVHVGTVQFALVNFLCHHFGMALTPSGDASDASGDRNLTGIRGLVETCRAIKRAWEAEPRDSEAAATDALLRSDLGGCDDTGAGATGADLLVGVEPSVGLAAHVTGS